MPRDTDAVAPRRRKATDTVQLKLRFKEQLRADLERAARLKGTSLNSEIVNRLGTTGAKPQHPLIGRGFHTVDDIGSTRWQGEVLADLGDGHFLVQLFEWLIGDPSTQHVVTLAAMAETTPCGVPRYRFFDNMQDANDYYERKGRHFDESVRREVSKARATEPLPADAAAEH